MGAEWTAISARKGGSDPRQIAATSYELDVARVEISLFPYRDKETASNMTMVGT